MTLAKRAKKQEAVLDIPVDPERLKELMEANFGHGGAPVVDRVTVPPGGGTSFQVPTTMGPQPQASLTGVVVFEHRARAYWGKQGESTGAPPECSSQDNWRGVGVPGGLCMNCPMNKWDTGKEGRGKACKEFHRVYLLQAGDTLPILLTVPPTSLREWDKYGTRVTREGNTLQEVVTSFTLVQDRAGGGQLFSRVFPISKGVLPEVQSRLAKDLKVALEPALLGLKVEDQDYPAPPAKVAEPRAVDAGKTLPTTEATKPASSSEIYEGILTGDPELAYTNDGQAVVRVPVTNGSGPAAVYAFGFLAESINQNLSDLREGTVVRFTGEQKKLHLKAGLSMVFVARAWEITAPPAIEPPTPTEPELPF